MIPFWQRPWLDGAKEHYEDDADEVPQCERCGAKLNEEDEIETGLCWDCLEPEE